MSLPAATIICVDCGGTAHLLNEEPEFGYQHGDLLVYRCADCNDRWDLIFDATEDGDGV